MPKHPPIFLFIPTAVELKEIGQVHNERGRILFSYTPTISHQPFNHRLSKSLLQLIILPSSLLSLISKLHHCVYKSSTQLKHILIIVIEPHVKYESTFNKADELEMVKLL